MRNSNSGRSHGTAGGFAKRGPDPQRADAVVEVLGGNVRHDQDAFEPGGTGLGLHVRDEQSPDPPSLRFVGDEQQVELRRGEDKRVEPEDLASLRVGADGYEDAVGLDVIRAHPVALDCGCVLALVGA